MARKDGASKAALIAAQMGQVRATARLPEAEAVGALTALLASAYPDVVAAAAEALGGLERFEAIGPLVEAYERADSHGAKSDPGCRVRRAIVHALAQLDARAAVGVMRRALRTSQMERVGFGIEDTAIRLRCHAGAALAQLDPHQAIHDLALLLVDTEPNCRIAAAAAIGALGEQACAAVLALRLLQPGHEEPEVLAACMQALAALKPPNLAELIEPFLVPSEEWGRGGDIFLVVNAGLALAAGLGEEALDMLIEAIDEAPRDARVPLVQAIASIRSHRTGLALLPLFTHVDPEVRMAAIEGAALYPSPEVEEAIRRRAANDPEERVRRVATHVLEG